MRNKSLNLLSGIMFCILFILTCGGGGGSSSSAPAPNISVSSSTMDFSGTILNSSIYQKFIIKNTGNANLNIAQITSPASPFSISSDTASKETLAPNQTRSLMVHFYPTSQGLSTGTFSIPSNDPDSPTVNVALKGEGYGLNVWINLVNKEACPVIDIDFTVSGPEDPLTTLTQSNFILKQNGTEVPNFDFLGKSDSKPVSVVLALDFSGSLSYYSDPIKDAAISFINNQLGPTDEAAICKFKADIEFYPSTSQLLTTTAENKVFLNKYIQELFTATDGTALYNAVIDSIDRATQGNVDNQLVVIVLSDGYNNYGESTLQDSIKHAKDIGIPVFTIYYVDTNIYNDPSPETMQQLAKGTGGQFYAGNNVQLDGIFKQISNVLSNKYRIRYSRYSSTLCTGSIDLGVRVEVKDVSDGLYGFYGMDSKTIVLP
jgi:VWFA-related protein